MGFNSKYEGKGGLKKFVQLRCRGLSFKVIGGYFGFTRQYSWSVGMELQKQGVLPSDKEIAKRLVQGLTAVWVN